MKKILVTLIVVSILLAAVCLLVHAETEITVSVSSASAQAGERVSLVFTLNGAPNANTLGIQFEYDTDILELVTDECGWLKDGAILSDFDPNTGKGFAALAYVSAQDLNGDIFKVTFRIKDGVKVGTTVSVGGTVVVKNGATEYSNTLTPATVTVEETVHTHSYETVSETTKICSGCGEINLTTSEGTFSGFLQKNDSAKAVRILMVVSRSIIDDPNYEHIDMVITVNGNETKKLSDTSFVFYKSATASGSIVKTDENCYLFGVTIHFDDLYDSLKLIEVSIVGQDTDKTLFYGSANLA